MTSTCPSGSGPDASEVRRELWRAFSADYALSSSRADSMLTIEYARVGDAVTRLVALVDDARERHPTLCWEISQRHGHLVLEISGPLAHLDVGELG